MRTKLAVAATAAVMSMAATASPALSAIGMSLHYVALPQHVTLEACLNLAETQLVAAGLNVLQRTNSAAWAEPTTNLDEIYSVYCIVDRGIAVIIGSGQDLDSVDGSVGRIFQNLDYAFNGK